MECVNLKERFGKRFKVGHDEAYFAERGERGFADDPQLQIIPGRRGHVFPGPGDLLAAFCRRGPTANRLKALPFVQVYTEGSDGVTVLFSADHLDQVAELLLLKRRRQITEGERQRLVELGRQHRFLSRGDGVGAQKNERPCVPAASVDL